MRYTEVCVISRGCYTEVLLYIKIVIAIAIMGHSMKVSNVKMSKIRFFGQFIIAPVYPIAHRLRN